MDRRSFAPLLLLAALAASPAAATRINVDCSLPGAGGAADAIPIRSRAELDAWLSRCPSPLDLMGAGARGRFLGSLGFNERGVTRLPTGDLTAELTGEEIAEVFTLLGLGADGGPRGLDPEEAEKLRSFRTTDSAGRGATDIELRYNALYYAWLGASFDSDDEFTAFITALYERLFPDDSIDTAGGATSHDLRLLYRAALLVSMISYRDDHLAAADGALAELTKRNLATGGDLRDMLKALIHAGHLEEARNFARRHVAAGLTPLPPLREPVPPLEGEPSVLRLAPAADALLHERVSLEPARIVVVASYGCRYSRAAARAIADDPQLGPIFREHALWLASPEHLDDLPALQRWNDAHPATPLVIAGARERWPMLDFNTVPQFHVFRDGRLQSSVTSGWPLDEGNREAVVAAVRSAGLLADP